MKSSNTTRNKGQVFSVGNYLMTGKILGKGHFASVEEATHRIIGKKVAIKIIDLTSIKEEYARRNLHREPRVMAKLRHPCIAALYETMMHGPRLFLVMEAAGGGDLCAHVLAAKGARGGRNTGGLPEARTRPLAAQLVSAVRHMHARGVVHRDLKMENIMLDTTKQYIKIVDFGLSNLWCAGGALRTPCGSLEYAAPELFLDGRRYGPEVDLWSIGVIVYGMVTGGLPFSGDGGEGASRPQLRAAIARGFTRKQRVALACVSTDCKAFIQHLLEPNVELRMKIEEAARHRWVKRPGMRMKTHPFATLEPKVNKEIYRQISELCSETIMDIVAQVKAEPFGTMAGMYNIKSHIHQLQSCSGTDLLWSPVLQECQPQSPPEYRPMKIVDGPDTSKTLLPNQQRNMLNRSQTQNKQLNGTPQKPNIKPNGVLNRNVALNPPKTVNTASQVVPSLIKAQTIQANHHIAEVAKKSEVLARATTVQSPRFSLINRPYSSLNKPLYKVYDNGDCCFDPRLPSIDEHSNAEFHGVRKNMWNNNSRMHIVGKADAEERPTRLNSCPNGIGDMKRSEFYRRAGDGLQSSWRATGAVAAPPPKILFQTHATTIKRASMGNIVSPHSSSNSYCKSERATPVGWYSTRNIAAKETHLQRFRKTTPMK